MQENPSSFSSSLPGRRAGLVAMVTVTLAMRPVAGLRTRPDDDQRHS